MENIQFEPVLHIIDRNKAEFFTFVRNVTKGCLPKQTESELFIVVADVNPIGKDELDRHICFRYDILHGTIAVTFKFPVNNQKALWSVQAGAYHADITRTFTGPFTPEFETKLTEEIEQYFTATGVEEVLKIFSFA